MFLIFVTLLGILPIVSREVQSLNVNLILLIVSGIFSISDISVHSKKVQSKLVTGAQVCPLSSRDGV